MVQHHQCIRLPRQAQAPTIFGAGGSILRRLQSLHDACDATMTQFAANLFLEGTPINHSAVRCASQ
jgi:hypothetical protein